MIDEKFSTQCGTDKQHKLICFLASKAGYGKLRYAVSDALGISVSKVGKTTVTVKAASQIIDWLKTNKSV